MTKTMQCQATLQMDEHDNPTICGDVATVRVYRKNGTDDEGVLCCPVCATTLLDSQLFFLVDPAQ